MATSPARARRPLAAALVSALLLAACGGDDGDAATTTTVADTTTTTTTTVDEGAEGAAAVNLRLDDFPDGWTAGPEPTDADEGDEGPLFECLGIAESIAERTVDEDDSPEFSRPTATSQLTAQSSTTVYDDEEVAEAVFEGVRGDEFVPCAREAFEEEFAADNAGGSMTIELTELARVEDVTVHGDDTIHLAGELTVTAEGQVIDAFVDLVLVRTGEVASFLTLVSFPEPFPAADANSLVVAVASRQGEVAA